MVTSDLLHLVMAQGSDDKGYDLFTSHRASITAQWSKPVPIVELSSPEKECDPWINDSRTVIVYCRYHKGDGDLLVAVRDDPADSFGEPRALESLNTAATEQDPWLSPDLGTIYFTRHENGSHDLFVATR